MRTTIPEAKKAVKEMFDNMYGFSPAKKDLKILSVTDDFIHVSIGGKEQKYAYNVSVTITGVFAD